MTSVFLKQALYRARHRGSKEADTLLGGFMEQYISSFDERALEACGHLFHFDDVDIFLWIEHPEKAPSSVNQEILTLLKRYIHLKKGW